jgi:hypothetical protein
VIVTDHPVESGALSPSKEEVTGASNEKEDNLVPTTAETVTRLARAMRTSVPTVEHETVVADDQLSVLQDASVPSAQAVGVKL